jgi:hypothetical protein
MGKAEHISRFTFSRVHSSSLHLPTNSLSVTTFAGRIGGFAMSQSAIATAADYADALFTARRAKNIFASVTALLLISQIALFFVARYKIDPETPSRALDLVKYFVGGIDFLGILAPLLLAIVLLVIVGVMLVGRLIGVSRVLCAFFYCCALVLMLFPWQAFLANQTFTSVEFKIPGVLYNWAELLARARFHPVGLNQELLFWARFVAWPVASLIVLAVCCVHVRHGLRQALGELPPEPFAPPANPT